MDFAVTGALELFEDHVVHAGPRVDERRGDDGERTTLFHVAGGAEEALRALQGVGVHTTGEHLAGAGYHGVVGASQTRDGVEEDDYVALVLDEALGLLDDHFCHLDVSARRLVEGGSNHFALYRTRHFRHFLGPLVDEQHDEVNLGVVVGDAGGNVLQQHGLAGLRRRDDETTLALAERRAEVDDAGGHVLGAAVAAL